MKDGRQIRKFVGESNFINIPPQYLFEFKDAQLIHNHPSNNTFSIEDIRMAIFHNVKEMYVITKDFSYSIKRPGIWPIDIEDRTTNIVLSKSKSIANEVVDKMISQFEIGVNDKEAIIFHYIWIFFFDYYKIDYERKEHSKNI
ncbi:hypothetical protein JKA74_01205 [Marivirga sp. S37H4]|uniref:Uncharacterized protein n=1 Tax=Marivirga aurantiaca TaxID=2802615 RepID=A0A935C565_9BACT|nr:hypothetical protein [Marivirga aurantiaca]MBK6263635.1 hypothetical protein [Marivirga aurantiaca]